MSLKQQQNFKNINPQSPAWFGNLPSRKPNKMPNPEQVLDLTADDEPTCDICEDDFNWPDENHACPLKQNKKMKLEQLTNTNESKKGGLVMLKEKIFKNNKPTPLKIAPKKVVSNISIDKKKQYKNDVVLPTRTMPTRTMPVRTLPVRTTTSSTRAMPTRIMPTRTMPTRRVNI